MNWFSKLFGLCDHKWEIIAKGNTTINGVVSGGFYDCRCEKCGRIKFFNG